MASLLPSHHSEFNSKSYWDRFFLERGDKAFEWYGSFENIAELLANITNSTDRTLVTGCGNSDFSARYYDSGYQHITNIDFSDVVINEMAAKNRDIRPTMKWDIGDITSMTQYPDSSYDVVFDKGTLDALMSFNSEETKSRSTSMFREIDRVLSSTGKYICVSLGEDFLITHLLDHFTTSSTSTANSWHVSMQLLTNLNSALRPLLIVISKAPCVAASAAAGKVTVSMDKFGGELLKPVQVAPKEAVDIVVQMQLFNQKRYNLNSIKSGRFETIDLYDEKVVVVDGKQKQLETPRFTIIIVDSNCKASRLCAVFFVPSGREAEFQFSTQEGLLEVAEQAECRRLLAVICNRPHIFPKMQELQAELSPIVNSLKPAPIPDFSDVIPYMALDINNKWEVIDMGTSSISGGYIVDEGPDDDEAPNKIMRRLIFMQNQNFIQTEVRLVEKKAHSSSHNKSKGKGKGKNKSKASSKKAGGDEGDGDDFEFDCTYLDAHHRGTLVSCLLSPKILVNSAVVCQSLNEKQKRVKDLEKMASSSSSSSRGSSCKSSSSSLCQEKGSIGLVVGLGGGAMVMAMQRYLPGMQLYCCDMDGDMESIAVKHFGLRCSSRTKLLVHEGMSLIGQISTNIGSMRAGSMDGGAVSATASSTDIHEPLDLLFIDADSKDPSLPLSAPPKAFITREALCLIYSVMAPGGVLAINAVARMKHLLLDLLDEIVMIWRFKGVLSDIDTATTTGNVTASDDNTAGVYMIKASDDTANVTIVAVKSLLAADTACVSNGSTSGVDSKSVKHCAIVRERLLEEWLSLIGLQSDPLLLGQILQQIEVKS